MAQPPPSSGRPQPPARPTQRPGPPKDMASLGLREVADPLIGAVLADKYRIDAMIGAGGMGAVYRATQLAVNRPVAVKVLRQVAGVTEDQLALRFQREALATSRLRHPNTVQVIDFGQTSSGMLYLVLELLEGAPLAKVIATQAPMAPERVAAIGKQIAKSLTEAHELGIVHRDLKPDNIFICNYHGDPDVPKVMDFGIARILTADISMTRTGMMIGTPRYMAPEQAMAKKAGTEADLYALGVILFEMLTGKPPFSADSAMALAVAHINEPIPRLVLPDAPEDLAQGWRDLLTQMLAKKPEQRPAGAAVVAARLAKLEAMALQASGGSSSPLNRQLPSRDPTQPVLSPTTRTGTSTSRVSSRRRRRQRARLLMGVGVVAFMALGGLVAWLLTKP